MSLTPMSIQNSFAMIHKSRVPDAAKRGRLFESAMSKLVEWWMAYFTVLPYGHIRSRTFEQVQEELKRDEEKKKRDRKGKGRARDVEEDDDRDLGEVIRSVKSLMKHALMRKGSRDTSAQLFTALCRSLGIPARSVVSLQSVPWQANVGKPKTSTKKTKTDKGKGKAKAVNIDSDEEDGDMEEIYVSSAVKGKFLGDGQRLDGTSTTGSEKGKQKAKPVINLRKSRGRKLGTAPPKPQPRRMFIHSLSRINLSNFSISRRAHTRSYTVSTSFLDRGVLSSRRAMDACRPYPRLC